MGEGGHEISRPWVRKHPVHLSLASLRLLEFARPRRFEQGVVGRRTPEEVGEPRGQFEVVEASPVLLANGLREIEEVRR